MSTTHSTRSDGTLEVSLFQGRIILHCARIGATIELLDVGKKRRERMELLPQEALEVIEGLVALDRGEIPIPKNRTLPSLVLSRSPVRTGPLVLEIDPAQRTTRLFEKIEPTGYAFHRQNSIRVSLDEIPELALGLSAVVPKHIHFALSAPAFEAIPEDTRATWLQTPGLQRAGTDTYAKIDFLLFSLTPTDRREALLPSAETLATLELPGCPVVAHSPDRKGLLERVHFQMHMDGFDGIQWRRHPPAFLCRYP